MQYAACAVIGYLIGMLNPSYFLAKCHGVDIRQRGSGNAGASNAIILFGKLRGVVCALFDIFKAAGVIWLTRALFPDDPLVFAISAAACILGHIFPFYMGFRGGKGLACLGGVILAFDLRVFGIMLACELIIALATNYICFVPLTASLAFPLIFHAMTGSAIGFVVLVGVAAVIVWRHIENLRRIRAGKELRISYLWNRDAESARMRKNCPESEWDHPEI